MQLLSVLQLQNDLPGPFVGTISFFSNLFKDVTVEHNLKYVATLAWSPSLL